MIANSSVAATWIVCLIGGLALVIYQYRQSLQKVKRLHKGQQVRIAGKMSGNDMTGTIMNIRGTMVTVHTDQAGTFGKTIQYVKARHIVLI